jgi:hypothetical protein
MYTVLYFGSILFLNFMWTDNLGIIVFGITLCVSSYLSNSAPIKNSPFFSPFIGATTLLGIALLTVTSADSWIGFSFNTKVGIYCLSIVPHSIIQGASLSVLYQSIEMPPENPDSIIPWINAITNAISSASTIAAHPTPVTHVVVNFLSRLDTQWVTAAVGMVCTFDTVREFGYWVVSEVNRHFG